MGWGGSPKQNCIQTVRSAGHPQRIARVPVSCVTLKNTKTYKNVQTQVNRITKQNQVWLRYSLTYTRVQIKIIYLKIYHLFDKFGMHVNIYQSCSRTGRLFQIDYDRVRLKFGFPP